MKPLFAREYYYNTGECVAENRFKPDCACWHSAGSGPVHPDYIDPERWSYNFSNALRVDQQDMVALLEQSAASIGFEMTGFNKDRLSLVVIKGGTMNNDFSPLTSASDMVRLIRELKISIGHKPQVYADIPGGVRFFGVGDDLALAVVRAAAHIGRIKMGLEDD